MKTRSHFISKKESKTSAAYKNITEHSLYLEQYTKYEESKKDTERNVFKDNNGIKCPDTLLCRP